MRDDDSGVSAITGAVHPCVDMQNIVAPRRRLGDAVTKLREPDGVEPERSESNIQRKQLSPRLVTAERRLSTGPDALRLALDRSQRVEVVLTVN
jgi:hypothetical protein